MASFQELLAQRAALDAEIARIQREERVEAINKVKTIMAEFGLTLHDIGRGALQTRPGPVRGTVAAPVKYRNPVTGETWSGRGLKPRWLAAALAEGKTLNDFSATAPAPAPAPASSTASVEPAVDQEALDAAAKLLESEDKQQPANNSKIRRVRPGEQAA